MVFLPSIGRSETDTNPYRERPITTLRYGPLSAFGTQADFPTTTSPQYGFERNSTWAQQTGRYISPEHSVRSFYGTIGADPGTYSELSDISLGRSGRKADFTKTLARARPPKGYFPFKPFDRYSMPPGSMGKQLLAHLPTNPAATFRGKITREQRDKMYVAPEYEKHFIGAITPGPLADHSNPVSSLRKQPLSTDRTAPRCTFGTQKRVTRMGNKDPDPDEPGPGSYHQTERFVSPRKRSPTKKRPE